MQAVSGCHPVKLSPVYGSSLVLHHRAPEHAANAGARRAMNLRDFRKAGRWPSLVSAFLYFDVSFMIWVLVGALAVSISGSFWPQPKGLTDAEYLRQIAPMKALMVSVPMLGGS